MAKKESTETPLMKQHREIKSKYPDAVLLFRVGDFYETLGQDAVIAAQVLGITLTKRANGSASHIELAGFPHFSLETYLHKLVKAGYRVAICDQLEDPKQAKGIVKRGVTELVTPGVASGDKLVETKSNNFLAALHLDEHISGVAFLDISTGEFFTAQGDETYMDKLIQSFQPSEIIMSKAKQKRFRELYDGKTYTFALEDWIFQDHYAYENLCRHFGTQSLKGFGIEELKAAIIAAGAVLHYLKDTEHNQVKHIAGIRRIVAGDYLWMDRFTMRNLELLPTAENPESGLLHALDNTLTPGGARLLKRQMLLPLFHIPEINRRLDLVSFFIKEQSVADDLRKHMRPLGDPERLVGKVMLKKVNPREVLQLAKSLQHLCAIKSVCEESGNQVLAQLAQGIDACEALRLRIEKMIDENAPAVAAKGGIIREAIHEDLDELRKISRSGKDYLIAIQQKETGRTGISSLKVAFNNVFGYYLEVTNVHKDKVPADWIRKQTLTNAERYVTPELKEYEEKILGAEEKILALEQQLYQQLLQDIDPLANVIQNNAVIAAQIDCLLCFASNAQKYNYHRPEIAEEPVIDIKQGRHPVIEQRLPPGEQYVANDIFLHKDEQQIIVLTGPNMSGKSALLRQTAIITLMAHMGSYVPADAARIGLTDKIFTRVGASDNLSGGESTFMVEMNETAGIVNNISDRSLVLLDEIGRGTSTYDGISIAWSLIEHLHQIPEKPKTLFATHYHELNELENILSGVKNYHITHRETADKVIFLRKLAPGGSRHSFGIQVARMAGMPQSLTQRAEEILAELEEKHKGQNPNAEKLRKMPQAKQFQLNIFDGLSDDLRAVQRILTETDVNTLTPVQALLKLNELKDVIKNYD